jgi:hypothetical protein
MAWVVPVLSPTTTNEDDEAGRAPGVGPVGEAPACYGLGAFQEVFVLTAEEKVRVVAVARQWRPWRLTGTVVVATIPALGRIERRPSSGRMHQRPRMLPWWRLHSAGRCDHGSVPRRNEARTRTWTTALTPLPPCATARCASQSTLCVDILAPFHFRYS